MLSFTTAITFLLHLSSLALAESDAVGVVHKGQITYYNTNGGVGACGTALSDSQAIVAVSAQLYDQYTVNGNPNNNKLCGKKIQIKSADGKRTATVTVRDRCAGCAMWDLDLTPTVFKQVVAGGLGVGRTEATWKFTS